MRNLVYKNFGYQHNIQSNVLLPSLKNALLSEINKNYNIWKPGQAISFNFRLGIKLGGPMSTLGSKQEVLNLKKKL